MKSETPGLPQTRKLAPVAAGNADLAATASSAPANGANLLERLRGGDAAAFEEVVRLHGGRMLAAARRLLPREDDAQDAVQEAFLSAFRAIHDFAGAAQLGTWLHRIVVNAALLRLRHQRRRPEVSIESMLPTYLADGHPADPVADWRESAQDVLSRQELRQAVREAIHELPENYRTVLMLRDIEGMDTRETALSLGIDENTVKVRLHRARQALRTLLDRRFRGDPP